MTPDVEPETGLARRWLAEDGLTQDADGTWWYVDAPGEPGAPAGPAERASTADIAEDWGRLVFDDEQISLADRVRVALGLMDLVGSHVLVHRQIHMAHLGPAGPLPADVLWDGYRRRLEAVPEPGAITDSLWLDWFEHDRTAESAFDEVLGRDAALLRAGAPEGLLRRARRVLVCSGPVAWRAKAAAYEAAAGVPELRGAVFEGVLASYHDLYGKLEPTEALALLDRLRLPAGTEHLAPLRTVLAAGHANHYRHPDAWRDAVGPRPG